MVPRQYAARVGRMQFDEDAEANWCRVYPSLSEGKPGMVGAVTRRGEAQVIRLSCLYALLDRSPIVAVEHLRAALALWNYCEASAEFVFSTTTGDETADILLARLRMRGGDGMTETEIRDSF